jgi:predicted amino acid dehydrogenase
VGNIGRVLAEIEVDAVESILLVGRPAAQRRLVRLAENLYGQAWQRVVRGETERGLARVLAHSQVVKQLKDLPNTEAAGAIIYEAFSEQPDLIAPIQLTTDLADLRGCNLIISATNSPEPLIGPEHIGPEPTVICDISVPTDVKPEVHSQCPQVRVIKGGIIRLPHQQDLSIRGMALPEGELYACLSEVVILGLSGIQHHFSYGPLQPERVRQIAQLAKQHQFSVVVNDGS